MHWKSLLDIRGLNIWLLASGIGLNLIWTYLVLLFVYGALSQNPAGAAWLQAAMLLAIFSGAFAIAWLIGRLADDNRGPTYGLWSSAGSLILIFALLVPVGGLLGLFAATVAVAGGLNGGLVSLKTRPR